MATVRDTEHTIVFVEGREVLDPNSTPFADWMAIIDSAVKVVSPKHLHAFNAAQDIVGMPIIGEVEYQYSSPPARIWLGRAGSSWEFRWHFQYLVCGTRFLIDTVDGVETISQEYLLFSKASEFFVLSTVWQLRNGKYHFSNNTNDHLKVRNVTTYDVIKWCLEDKKRGPYLLREVLEHLFEAAEKTE